MLEVPFRASSLFSARAHWQLQDIGAALGQSLNAMCRCRIFSY
jgi:hypothetical protein